MIKSTLPISYFMGANCKAGYCSLLPELYNPYEPGKHYILKGGPGTGKSTLMKRAAAQLNKKGYEVELGFCSADPHSLDSVYAPQIGFSIVDGTSPHVVDPTVPGVNEHLISLGEAWNRDFLLDHRAEICELTRQNKLMHKKCADYLWVASGLKKETSRALTMGINNQKLGHFTERFITRTIGRDEKSNPGKAKRRFISGITPDGVFIQHDTAEALCDKIICLKDPWGVFAPYIIAQTASAAINAGLDVIECLCPLSPYSVAEHIIIPEKRLGIFTENSFHRFNCDELKTIRAERFFDTDYLFSCREKLRFSSETRKELIDEAVKKLSSAKGIHDRLEEYYIKATDFSMIDEKAELIFKEAGII